LQEVLAQTKNRHKLFWEEELHAANGKAQACTQGALLFLFLSLGEREGFFSFFLHSQCVPTMFPSSSQWVPSTMRLSLLGPLNTWAHWLYNPSP